MPMDPQLAAIYGTNQDESDVEKLAAAELAEELADEGEEVEESDLSDEEAEELAQQLLAAEGEEGAEQGDEEDEEGAAVEEPGEEEQEKLSEADYLGRVMAHAYTQELRKIAAVGDSSAYEGKDTASRAQKVGGWARRQGHRAAGAAKAFGKHFKGGDKWSLKGQHAGKTWGARAAVGAAAGAAGYGAYRKFKGKGKKKQSAAEPSALDILAERRALEILAENGIDPTQEQEKTSASEPEMEALGNAVEQRAYALLQANGYIQEQE